MKARTLIFAGVSMGKEHISLAECKKFSGKSQEQDPELSLPWVPSEHGRCGLILKYPF